MANTTPSAGCRFEKSEAREGPTREIVVNQRMLVRNSGPTTANANPIQTSAPKWNDWLVVCGIPTAAIGFYYLNTRHTGGVVFARNFTTREALAARLKFNIETILRERQLRWPPTLAVHAH